MGPKTVEDLIADYVRTSGISKKEVLRKFQAVFNVGVMGWILIQKKFLCRHCQGDGQKRCDNPECLMDSSECTVCNKDPERRVAMKICTHCQGHGTSPGGPKLKNIIQYPNQ